jgi:putative redox protein
LRTKIINLQNSKTIFTDAPIDNHGEGKYFSPTDLMAVSLGSCIITLIAIQANILSISINGTYLNMEKIMKGSPRQLGSILINIYLPDIEKSQQKRLESAALNCPVYRSFHPEIEKKLIFHWGSI